MLAWRFPDVAVVDLGGGAVPLRVDFARRRIVGGDVRRLFPVAADLRPETMRRNHEKK